MTKKISLLRANRSIILLLILVVMLSSTISIAAAKEDNAAENDKLKAAANSESDSSYEIKTSELKQKLQEAKSIIEDKKQLQQERLLTAREKASKITVKWTTSRIADEDTQKKLALAKAAYQADKQRLLKLKENVGHCRNDCSEPNEQLKKGIVLHLAKTNELIKRSLDNLLNQLNQAPISEEQKAQASEQILILEEKIITLNSKLSSLYETRGSEELREAVADLKTAWKEVRQVQRRIIASLIQSKLSQMLIKNQEFLNGVDLRINALKNEGIDVSQLETLRSQFEKHIQQFKLDYDETNLILEETKSGHDVLDELHANQINLENQMQQTKQLLREFLVKYNYLKNSAKDKVSA